MKRSSFLKSLLTLIVAPKVIGEIKYKEWDGYYWQYMEKSGDTWALKFKQFITQVPNMTRVERVFFLKVQNVDTCPLPCHLGEESVFKVHDKIYSYEEYLIHFDYPSYVEYCKMK